MAEKSENLHDAAAARQDEYYTRLPDIESELQHYKEHFKGKVVYCNCDDPLESNFFIYFVKNFKSLGLKKLITTCYDGSPVAGSQLLFPFVEEGKLKPKQCVAYKIVITDVEDFSLTDGKTINFWDVKEALRNGTKKAQLETLEGNGDFRSEECEKLLEQADVIVTNPPFSYFKEHIAQIFKHQKEFLVLGNKNAITFKEIFPLIMGNKMWVGVTSMSKDMLFFIPPEYIEIAIKNEKPSAITKDEEGRTVGRSAAVWFTNLSHGKRNEPLNLTEDYSPEKYPRYDNYDGIDVGATKDIPRDYNGVMGVPITFLDKYNPDQFEIVGLGNSRENFTPNKEYINPVKHLKNGTTESGGAVNCVLTVATKKKPAGVIYYTSDNSDYLTAPYARILIRRKN